MVCFWYPLKWFKQLGYFLTNSFKWLKLYDMSYFFFFQDVLLSFLLHKIFCSLTLAIWTHSDSSWVTDSWWGLNQKIPSENSGLKQLQKCVFIFCPFIDYTNYKTIICIIECVLIFSSMHQVKTVGPVFIHLNRKNINLILFTPIIMATLLHFLFQLDCLSIFYDYINPELFFLSHAHNF